MTWMLASFIKYSNLVSYSQGISPPRVVLKDDSVTLKVLQNLFSCVRKMSLLVKILIRGGTVTKWRDLRWPMVSSLFSGSSVPASSPGRGHCAVFSGKTLYSHSASLHSGVSECVPANVTLGVTLQWISIPSSGESQYS